MPEKYTSLGLHFALAAVVAELPATLILSPFERLKLILQYENQISLNKIRKLPNFTCLSTKFALLTFLRNSVTSSIRFYLYEMSAKGAVSLRGGSVLSTAEKISISVGAIYVSTSFLPFAASHLFDYLVTQTYPQGNRAQLGNMATRDGIKTLFVSLAARSLFSGSLAFFSMCTIDCGLIVMGRKCIWEQLE